MEKVLAYSWQQAHSSLVIIRHVSDARVGFSGANAAIGEQRRVETTPSISEHR
jgi:hypothetical protein